MTPHGSYSTYQNWRCRCDACREANRLYHIRARERRKAKPRSEVPHGTPGGYTNWGCRCAFCRLANNEAKRAWRAAA